MIFGLSKNFTLREPVRLRFEMNMANALNHPSFALPAANISSPGTVGVISGTTAAALVEPAARQFNFSLRFSF